jgi:hypothetical protein
VKKTKLQSILESRDAQVMDMVQAYLRAQAPRLVPTHELAMSVRRSHPFVYGLIKKLRYVLRKTTGESVPNIAKRKGRKIYGYTITNDGRAKGHEAQKSYDRAAGHLIEGGEHFSTWSEPDTSASLEDCKLWLALQNQKDAAEMFLKSQSRSRQLENHDQNNRRLAAASAEDSRTPWETIGHEDPAAETP